jgi:hypothetical protein
MEGGGGEEKKGILLMWQFLPLAKEIILHGRQFVIIELPSSYILSLSAFAAFSYVAVLCMVLVCVLFLCCFLRVFWRFLAYAFVCWLVMQSATT